MDQGGLHFRSSNQFLPKSMNQLISLFSSASEAEPEQAITIGDFLRGVKNGTWSRPIEILRNHIARNDRTRYDHKKRHLPAATISCHCLSRERSLDPDAKDITHSGLMQGDFDLKDNPILDGDEAVEIMRSRLIEDEHVLAVFVGPSGEGIKTIVAIDPARHSDSWFAAEKHFRDKYDLNLDRATKDPMRLCFVSHDTKAKWKDEASPIPLPEAGEAQQHNDWLPPVETTAADIAEMLRFIPSRPDYDTWLRIASAVWSVLPLEEGCRILNQWSPEEKPGEYATKHKARLVQIGVGTLAHIASLHGFDARAAYRRRRWAGRIRFADSARSAAESEDPTIDPTPAKSKDIPREQIVAALNSGQAGDARLWCAVRKGLRVWNIHAKLWMCYESGVWLKDSGNATRWDISDTLIAIYEQLADSVRAEIKKSPSPDNAKDHRKKEVDGIQKRIIQLCAWDYLAGVERFAATSMNVPATAFDKNPDILVLQNGTIDFSERIFREHRYTDMATIKSPIVFRPETDCPKWSAFLARFIPDMETRTYLARAVGYSLTGRVNFDAMFFAYGKGANGKSTFFQALKILLGDLMTSVPITALLAAKSDNNFDYHKANMEGKRVVLTDEIPEGRHLAESQVKALTGGDPINARRPYEQPYVFMPTHKLWLMGNHKPEIKGVDEGMWRRVHMVPFLVTIPEHERRPRHEITQEFYQEASGILNWAIRGLIEAMDIGLMPPPQVVEATKQYREESDQFGTFLAECTGTAPNALCGCGALFKAYSAWCEMNGETPRHRGTRQVRKAISERGFHIEIDRNDHPQIAGLFLKTEENQQNFALVK
jgi:P4 family phage/plasmid primase-like protien